MKPTVSSVKSIVTVTILFVLAMGMVVAFVVADRAKTRSLYQGPEACPLVATEDLLRLGNPPVSRMFLDRGLESDVKRSWTETWYSRTTRTRTKASRSQKVGQQCLWIWVADTTRAEKRASLRVAVLNESSVSPSWRSAPALAGSVAAIEGLAASDRPSVGWRWSDLLAPSGSTVVNCTVRQVVGLRFLDVTWSSRDADADCAGTMALAVNAGDRLVDADRASTTTG
jgi:hypothetical protein